MSKIFVSIACFCDKDIKNTIEDCLLKAKNPDDIIFGICLQYDPEDDFLKEYDNKPQFRIKKIHWKEAKGPTYARYLISKLLENEEYFLQIDCHTRFFENWDVEVVSCLEECNDPKAILTTFPIGIKNMDNKSLPLNKSTLKFHSLSKESIKLGAVCSNGGTYQKTYYLSAAFLFGDANFVREVKFDPYLTYSYQTIEQQFYAVRLFTNGWNLYMPSRHILATNYDKTPHYDSKNNRILAPSNVRRGKLSWQRVSYYYGLISLDEVDDSVKENIDLYGLGSTRTLEDFFKIHNEEGCIDKIKSGLKYNKGTWELENGVAILENKNISSKFTFKCSNPIFRKVINENKKFTLSKDDKSDFSWDINPKNYDSKVQHYFMNTVSFIDNKKVFFELLIKNNCNSIIPNTFFDPDNLEDNKNYFLKYAGNNGGKQVHLFNDISQLRDYINNNKSPYIIQEEVDNMLLIDGKKFVLRNWIVIINGKFYLSVNGCCIVHEIKYDKNDLDRKRHIDHDISKIGYTYYNEMDFYKDTFEKVLKLTQEICDIILKRLNFRDNCFQVLGLDIIFDNNNNPYLIEVNSWPNMSVPFGNYKLILEEFFTNFLNDIILQKLENKPIIDNKYFCEINTEKLIDFKNIISYNDSLSCIVITNENSFEVTNSLKNSNINFSLFDVMYVNTNKFNELINSKKISLDRYKLRNDQVSLWLTHLHIWQKMIEDNVDKLLIIESSCKFVSNFTEMYNSILAKSKFLDYDILYLGYCGVSATNEKLSLTNTGCPRLTSSYIITLNGAKKLVEKLSFIDYPFDEILGNLFFKKEINGYRTTQLLTYQDFQLNKPNLYRII